MRDEKDDSVSIAESTDSKRPQSPEPPKLKDEIVLPSKETITALTPVIKPEAILPDKLDVREKPTLPEAKSEVKPLMIVEPEPVRQVVPILEVLKEEQESKVEEEVPQPILEMEEGVECPAPPDVDQEQSENKDSQPPVIDKEVHTEEELPQPAEPKVEDKVKKMKKKELTKAKKKLSEKVPEAKKEEAQVEKVQPVADLLPKEEESKEPQPMTESPEKFKDANESSTQPITPEKDEVKSKKLKGEKKSEKKKALLAKKTEESKSDDNEKKPEPEKKKTKKKVKKKDDEEKTAKVPESKKQTEQKSAKMALDVYDFKEESQDSEQAALIGLASLHTAALSMPPPVLQPMVGDGGDLQGLQGSRHVRNDSQTFRDALALVSPSPSTSQVQTQPSAFTPVTKSSTGQRDTAATAASSSAVAMLAAAASTSSAMYDNTPPDTPEHSPSAASPHGMTSPSHEQKGQEEMEHIAHPTPLGGDSPGNCDMSTISNSSGGSSGNLPSGESSGEGGSKRKREPEVEVSTPSKKRRRSSKRGQVVDKPKPVTPKANGKQAYLNLVNLNG